MTMLSEKTICLKGNPNCLKEKLRLAIISELDAINLYEQLSNAPENEDLTELKEFQTVITDIIKEEKTHVGELQALLLKFDEEQASQLSAGQTEANYLISIK